jgi:putative tryptophan/tyrosine transport system substrate-binding protein
MRLSAIGLILTFALGILTAPLVTDAQPATQVYRIGRLLSTGRPLPEPNAYEEAFRQRLRELGYVEGQNLVLEYRYAEGSAERLPDLAAELVQLQVDVIVAGGTAAIRAAQLATRTIPIVMSASYDPVQEGFVASLARPEGNITGLSYLQAELPGKRLELLKERVPQSTRIAVLWNPVGPGYASRQSLLQNLTVAARALGLHLHVVEVRHADELATAFAALPQARADALLVMEDALVFSTRLGRRLADLAAASRLPAMYSWREHVDAGGLMAYGPSLQETYRRAATYVDKILKGAKPADLPVEQPTKFELVINLKTAQALGLTIPPTLLFQAEEVIR